MNSQTINQDLDRLLESASFSDVVRFRGAPYWIDENKVQDLLASQPHRHLESDAEHSWQVSDMVLLLGPHWPQLDLGKALQMAILHDKVEIFTGDAVVTGKSGDGSDSHAFNETIKQARRLAESEATEQYLSSLAEDTRAAQGPVLREYELRESLESKFVDALDKLQTIIWSLYSKKGQSVDPGAIKFSEAYKKPRIAQFPGLLPYYEEAMTRLRAYSNG